MRSSSVKQYGWCCWCFFRCRELPLRDKGWLANAPTLASFDAARGAEFPFPLFDYFRSGGKKPTTMSRLATLLADKAIRAA